MGDRWGGGVWTFHILDLLIVLVLLSVLVLLYWSCYEWQKYWQDTDELNILILIVRPISRGSVQQRAICIYEKIRLKVFAKS